jgi:signal transduction histidine kinase
MLHAYRSLDAEEAATLGFFAEALFDEMEAAAAALVRREEARPVDAYAAPPATGLDGLRELPVEDFIRGYFQNNPDGSLQTPHQAPGPELASRLAELAEANRRFNGLRAEGTDRLRPMPAEEPREERRQDQERFAGQYLDSTRSRQAKSYLGERDSRREKVTPEQVYNMEPGTRSSAHSRVMPYSVGEEKTDRGVQDLPAPAAKRSGAYASSARGEAVAGHTSAVQAEVAPFQSVFLDRHRVFTFRRVVIDGRMYRQGFVIRLDDFLAHLRLQAVDQGVDAAVVDAGPPADRPLLKRARTFPPPFGFLRATLASDSVPATPGRSTLNLALAALAAVILGGLVAIYHVSRRIVDYSERRARFVASVTRELKTPLTNIRMYVEMLEQGMARDPEREQAYFRILHSESARLSRLIGNVLELSRLERRQRRPDLASGTFDEVLDEVAALLAEPLRQEGFVLERENRLQRPFRYDREIMVQVLLNLIENSLKFGRASAVKRIAVRVLEVGERVRVEVADSGPGIPPGDLKKVFEDFYRAENAMTAAVGGTGIGLAMVRRFVQLLGGAVSAANNEGLGCTIRIDLPRT